MRVRHRIRRHWPLLGPITVSAVLSSWALGAVGWGNLYYSAAVRSMSRSWSAFVFGALDTAGFVTVDKPPLSLWVQALSVRMFGFHPMALLVPQVLASIGAVVLLYATVVHRWGRAAALVASVALAVTPITVMVAHSNNPDAVLVLTMTASLFFAVRSVPSGSWRWLLAAAVAFGAAFTTKMLAAAPVLPAVLLAFVLGSMLPWRRRLLRAAVGGAVAITSALAWFAFVDLTPESERPYVGSSTGNRAFQLAFERNGIGQVGGAQDGAGGGRPPLGSSGGPPNGRLAPSDRQPGLLGGLLPGVPGVPGVPGADGTAPPGAPTGAPPMGLPADDGAGRGGPGGMARGFAGGVPGVLRLLNADLGTQLGWFVVPVLASAAAVIGTQRRRVLRDPVVVGSLVWFGSGALVYSITEGIVHPYYLASIAPPAAALVGVGVGVALERWDAPRTRVLLGLAVTVSGVASLLIARSLDWMPATSTSGAVVLAGLGIVGWACTRIGRTADARWLPVLGAAVLGAAVLAVPSVWTIGSLAAGVTAHMPYADPTVTSASARPGPPGGTPVAGTDETLVRFLRANRGDARWLLATSSAMTAAPIIIETGEPVMALGGFSGGDRILSSDELDALFASGRLRYVLLGGGRRPGGMGASDLAPHVQATCDPVVGFDSLYDCDRSASG